MAKRLNGGELYPRHERDRYQAEMLLAGVVDLVAEGHDAWYLPALSNALSCA
jgi:glutathione S-transferase